MKIVIAAVGRLRRGPEHAGSDGWRGDENDQLLSTIADTATVSLIDNTATTNDPANFNIEANSDGTFTIAADIDGTNSDLSRWVSAPTGRGWT